MNQAQNGNAPAGRNAAEQPLKGWREIAGFLGRDQSTVRRWATDRGLPVFRGGARGLSVHAFASELEAWLRAEAGEGRQAGHVSSTAEAPVGLRPGIARPGRRRMLAGLCLGAAFGLGSATTFGAMVLAGRRSVGGASEIPERARELYVRGSFLWSRRTPDSVAEAIRLLRQAVEIHPAYGEAHAALAVGYILAHRCRAMPGWSALPKAERAARRAIELDPGLDLAQGALGFIELLWHWDLGASLSRFERALGVHPRSAETLYWHAAALMLAGRAEVALPLALRAQEASPDSSAVRNLLARTLFHCGRAAEATMQAEEIGARDPGYPWSHETLAVIRLGSRDYKGYLESRGALADRIGSARERELAAAGREAFAAGGLPAMTEAMVRVETAHYARGAALALDVARALAIVGRSAEALSWLEISFGRHETRLIALLADPAFLPLRGDPQFADLVSRLGLAASGAV